MDSVSESQTCAALLIEIKMATDHSTAQLCGVGNLNIFGFPCEPPWRLDSQSARFTPVQEGSQEPPQSEGGAWT